MPQETDPYTDPDMIMGLYQDPENLLLHDAFVMQSGLGMSYANPLAGVHPPGESGVQLDPEHIRARRQGRLPSPEEPIPTV